MLKLHQSLWMTKIHKDQLDLTPSYSAASEVKLSLEDEAFWRDGGLGAWRHMERLTLFRKSLQLSLTTWLGS